jgi:hypothetical protein
MYMSVYSVTFSKLGNNILLIPSQLLEREVFIIVKKKVYLYRLLSDLFNNSVSSNIEDGIFVANNWPLLGLDRKIWRGDKIKAIENTLPLKSFEVRQKKFDLFISYSNEFDIDLLRIDFTNELLDTEHDEIKGLLRSKDIKGLLDFIDEQRFDLGNDVEEITFIENKHLPHTAISFSREAVLTLELNEENLPDIMSTEPIGILAGTYIPFIEEERDR